MRRQDAVRGGAEPRLLTGPFALAFAVSVLSNLVFHTYNHFGGFLAERGASDVFVGAAMGFMGLAGVLARPTVGRAMDLGGRRGVLIAGCALHVVACLGYFALEGPGVWVFVVRFLHGLAVAATGPVLFTMAADLAPEGRKTEGIALFGLSGLAPLAGGGILGDAVLGAGGWPWLFATTAALAALALALSFAVPESRSRTAGAPAPRSFLASAVQRELRPVWLIGTFFALPVSSEFFFVKRYVMDTGVGSVGLFFTAYAAAAIGLRAGLAWLPERLGPKRVLIPSVVVAAGGLFLFARGETALALALAGGLTGLGHGFAFPITMGLAVSRSRPEERGAAMSLGTATFDVGMLLGGLLFGAVLEATDYPTTFATAGAIMLVGLAAFAIVDRGR